MSDARLRCTVLMEQNEDGGYTVTVPSLPGCISEGSTREEAPAEIEEAITEECGCDSDYVIADLVKNENTLFKSASILLEEDKFPFLIERRDGKIQEIDSFSTFTYTGSPRRSLGRASLHS